MKITHEKPISGAVVPIVLIHKDEPQALAAMLKSIHDNTRYPYRLFIVDNASSSVVARDYLAQLMDNTQYNLICNKKNNWVFGFNLVFKHPNWNNNDELMVFSDCDIVVPQLIDGEPCWLEYLKIQMDEHACIGKLGLSLSVEGLQDNSLSRKIIKREASFDLHPTIGTNKICGVDTTLAIYRKDFFMMSEFKFLIGHASLAKPHYYTCRVSRKYQAKHLGWYKRLDIANQENFEEKVLCFAKYAAYIEPEVLASASWQYRYYFKFISPLAKSYWSVRVLLIILFYFIKSFPRAMNPLQNAVKYE